ncbi:MAG: hypothetical protein HY289_07555 [Planctomycetes bacterium]|nr:hypothetical protein [Planctomycetota bacterium]
MKRFGLFLGFLAVLAIMLPLTAQDAKKEADKKDKADEKKVDPDKKKIDPDKKDVEKKEEKKKEKLVYGNKFSGKIVGMKGESARELTVETMEVDPKKVYDNNLWAADQQRNLAQQQFNIQKIPLKEVQNRQNALINYNKAVAAFQTESARRATQVYTAKRYEVTAGDSAKVRTMFLPIEFDDLGNQKKFTKKEFEDRKDKIGLPGYFPAEFDLLKQGQSVEVYMAKAAVTPKTKKKGPDDDPGAPALGGNRAEFVLIVILAEQK